MSNGKTTPPAAPFSRLLDLCGRTIGDFRVLRKLGQGGMGQVYLAEQISLKRNVALKILRPEMASSPTAMQRFEAEATAVAKVAHANIVQVYAFGVEEGLAYMALEYVEGKNLKEYLVKKGPPDLFIALSIMRQVASALQRASEHGLIHRDIKPENILLTRKTEVKVADFGLVRCLESEGKPALNLTQSGVSMGTPLYMSPEQVEGKPVDARTDIYSFGVTCYHMLTGQPPFRGSSEFEVAVQHVQKQPVPLGKIRPDLPEALCAIVHKMMEKDPNRRYQTGQELRTDIARLRENLSSAGSSASQALTDEPPGSGEIVTTPDSVTHTQPVTRPPNWVWLLIAGGVLSVLVALGAGAAFAWRDSLRQGPLPLGKEVSPADATATDNIPLPSKEEQTLRTAVEQYLNPPSGKVADGAGGLGVCMDLALWYLDRDRRDDADKLFGRLEAIEGATSYRLFGRVGRAIVLALNGKAEESNKLFLNVFGATGPKGLGGKDKGAFFQLQKLEKQLGLTPLAPLFEKPGWRSWLGRARWHNKHNGISENAVPFYLRQQIPLEEPPPLKFGPPKLDKDKPKPADKDKLPPRKDKAG